MVTAGINTWINFGAGAQQLAEKSGWFAWCRESKWFLPDFCTMIYIYIYIDWYILHIYIYIFIPARKYIMVHMHHTVYPFPTQDLDTSYQIHQMIIQFPSQYLDTSDTSYQVHHAMHVPSDILPPAMSQLIGDSGKHETWKLPWSSRENLWPMVSS